MSNSNQEDINMKLAWGAIMAITLGGLALYYPGFRPILLVGVLSIIGVAMFEKN